MSKALKDREMLQLAQIDPSCAPDISTETNFTDIIGDNLDTWGAVDYGFTPAQTGSFVPDEILRRMQKNQEYYGFAGPEGPLSTRPIGVDNELHELLLDANKDKAGWLTNVTPKKSTLKKHGAGGGVKK